MNRCGLPAGREFFYRAASGAQMMIRLSRSRPPMTFGTPQRLFEGNAGPADSLALLAFHGDVLNLSPAFNVSLGRDLWDAGGERHVGVRLF